MKRGAATITAFTALLWAFALLAPLTTGAETLAIVIASGLTGVTAATWLEVLYGPPHTPRTHDRELENR